MDTMTAILDRRSCRAFTAEALTESEIKRLLVAANATPVGMAQFEGVALTVVTDPEVLAAIEANMAEKMPDAPNKHPLYGAPCAIVMSGKVGDGPAALMIPMSIGCAMENVMLEATELGLASCFIMGATALMAANPELCARVKVPGGFRPLATAAVGHAAQPLEPHEPTTEKLALAEV